MEKVIEWLKSQHPMSPKTVVMPGKNFHFQLRKSMAESGDLKYLFNCELTTPIGFINNKLKEIGEREIVDFYDVMYSFKVCLSDDLFGKLSYFDKDQLKEGRGYSESFAKTLIELDQAGLSPEELKKFDYPESKDQQDRIRDVGHIWEQVFKVAGVGNEVLSLSSAVELLKEQDLGDVYWYGGLAESQILKDFASRYTYEVFEAKTDELPQKFQVESWASSEEEDRASLAWVLENLEVGDHFNDLAIISPSPKQSLIDLLVRNFGEESVYSPKGLVSTNLGTGAKVRDILEMMKDNLPGNRMPRVLASLKAPEVDAIEKDKKKLVEGIRFTYVPKSISGWTDVINQTGCVGGNRASATGVVDFEDRIFKYWPEAEFYREGINRIVSLTKMKNQDVPLADLVDVLGELILGEMRVSKQDTPFMKLFINEAKYYSQRPWAKAITGEEGLDFLLDILEGIRRPLGRLGEARLFVGTMQEALGLNFNKVRLCGFQEGAYPSNSKQDPILSDELRKAICDHLMTTDKRLKRDHQVFEACFDQKTTCLTMATYRQNIDGTEKSFSGAFLDVLDKIESGGKLLDLFETQSKQRCEAILSRRMEIPYLQESRYRSLKREPSSDKQVLPNDSEGVRTALENRIDIKSSKQMGVNEGLLGEGACLEDDAVLSPSMVGKLLACPRAYLYEQLCGFSDEDAVLEVGALDAMTRGTMIHWIIEKINLEKEFSEIEALNVPSKEVLIADYIDRCFEQFPISNFLGGRDAINNEKQVFSDVIMEVFNQDAKLGVKSAKPEQKVKFSTGNLSYSGKIDRVETLSNGKTRVVDFKSGRGYNKDRNENPYEPGYDIQLVLYLKGLLENKLIDEKNLEGLDFRYPENPELGERSFTGESLKALKKKGNEWIKFLEAAHKERFFPPNANEKNCMFCPFSLSCDANSIDYSKKEYPKSDASNLYKIINSEEGEA
ncbi:MAG: PD-(D/E)XK nuclease family protein [Deltaproteobacteria bacterium]|nr:MAG: PD-(D/E)XK nuclease family protein [Deltaproteobacteria bacterium]